MGFSHFLQIILPDCDDACFRAVVPSILLGISYSTYSCILWSNVAFVVPEKTLGTAFGILAVVQNIVGSVSPYVVGYLNDNTTAQ
jgi:uncharacterized membrane protein